VWIIIGIAFIVLVAVMFFRTFSGFNKGEGVEPVSVSPADSAVLSAHLSEVVQIKTVSRVGSDDKEKEPFLAVHRWMESTYPNLHNYLDKEIVNTHSLLYTWRGSDSALEPVLFNAHMDVVPVSKETLAGWSVEPFSGQIKNGYVWGRGTLDMKNQLVALLEAVEALLKEGYTPRRTIYLAFGHDEEIMGYYGSRNIMKKLKSKNTRLAAVFDEGGMITRGMLPGVEEPIALVGNTEKGYLTLEVSAQGNPGHSSTPPRQTAIGVLARALALMDDHPMHATLDYFLPTLMIIRHHLPFGLQFIIANSWLFKPLLIKKLEQSPKMNAMLRTTNAATVIAGGVKDNVLPATASAKVNCRVLPGDSVQSVIDHFEKAINDPRVTVKIDEKNGGWEASAVSSTHTAAYRTLDLVIKQIFDDVTVAPFTFLAATDSRHYQPICDNIYKFSPIEMTPKEQDGAHGINEKVSVKSLGKMVVFFKRLMVVWGDAGF